MLRYFGAATWTLAQWRCIQLDVDLNPMFLLLHPEGQLKCQNEARPCNGVIDRREDLGQNLRVPCCNSAVPRAVPRQVSAVTGGTLASLSHQSRSSCTQNRAGALKLLCEYLHSSASSIISSPSTYSSNQLYSCWVNFCFPQCSSLWIYFPQKCRPHFTSSSSPTRNSGSLKGQQMSLIFQVC